MVVYEDIALVTLAARLLHRRRLPLVSRAEQSRGERRRMLRPPDGPRPPCLLGPPAEVEEALLLQEHVAMGWPLSIGRRIVPDVSFSMV